MNVIEIPSAIRNFIKHFFGCRHCSDNFMNETHDLHQLDSNDKNAAMIYLWKSNDLCLHVLFVNNYLILVHNHVNQRLHGDETEDPKYPKIQFPPENLCSKCQSTNKDQKFDLTNTIEFLRRFYSKENLDLSSVETISISHENKDRISFKEQYSMIELNDESTIKSGFLRFTTSIIRRFPFYFLISLVIVIFFARRRYCKGKRKRYTL
jgi:thiol oxidase